MLVEIAMKNELMRKQFCKQLCDNASEVERLENQHLNDENRQLLSHHTFMILQEQLKTLSNSIDNISIDKKLGDNLNLQISELKKHNLALRDDL